MKRLAFFSAFFFAALAAPETARAQAKPLPSGDVQKIYERLLQQIEQSQRTIARSREIIARLVQASPASSCYRSG